jgi:hypothetical protein
LAVGKSPQRRYFAYIKQVRLRRFANDQQPTTND